MDVDPNTKDKSLVGAAQQFISFMRFTAIEKTA